MALAPPEGTIKIPAKPTKIEGFIKTLKLSRQFGIAIPTHFRQTFSS